MSTFTGWSISNGSNYTVSPTTWFIEESNYPKLYYTPKIETKAIDNNTITSTTATLNGELKYYYNVDVYFQYREVSGTWTNTAKQTKINLGNYTQNITELSPNTTYEYRAAVDHSSTTDYGEILTFSNILLSSIAVTTPADKLNYSIGETLDITGLVITKTYSNGSTQIALITTDNITNFDSSTAEANQTLTVTVDGVTTTYNVNIISNKSSSRFTPSKKPEIIINNLETTSQINEGFVIKGNATTYASYPDRILIQLDDITKYPDFLKCNNQKCNWKYTIPELSNNKKITFTIYDKTGLSNTISFDIVPKEKEQLQFTEKAQEEPNKDVTEKTDKQLYNTLLHQIISLLQQILTFYK